MIVPSIHRALRRSDLTKLVLEIARAEPDAAEPAARALEAGEVDVLLDQPAALEAVRGRGGVPAPLPLTLLWYVPVRAALRERGESAVDLADYTASVPLACVRIPTAAAGTQGWAGLADFQRAISSLPRDTLVRGERAADCGAVALWWAACFPERLYHRAGKGIVRAYVAFAAGAFSEAARILGNTMPEIARLLTAGSERIDQLYGALRSTAVDYLGRNAHTADGRINRYLARLEGSLS